MTATVAALDKLARAQAATGSLLSVGLEPCAEYLPRGFANDIDGHRAFLRAIVDGTRGAACAYKFNLAFFEALGPRGWDLLREMRAYLPADSLAIADAKRGDIGSTARCYAQSMYGDLAMDAATINPLMGRDSAEPFLAWRDRLNIFLCLTSNPGAADFLAHDGLYLRIARAVAAWDGGAGNCALVTGATQATHLAAIREAAPALPFLVPGVGAQGGDIAATIRNGRMRGGDFTGLILHVTRGILPSKDDAGDAVEIVARKVREWNAQVAKAF